MIVVRLLTLLTTSIMRRIVRYPQLLLPVIAFGLLTVIFASPLLNAVAHEDIRSVFANCYGDGWCAPFARSASFAIITTLVCVPVGFLLALLAKDCVNSLRMPLAVLMMPMLMGGVAVAFCVKLDILHSALVVTLISNRSFLPTWGLMLLAQAWQLLTLSIYLFWFRLQLIPSGTLSFAATSGLSPFEYVRDVYWPHTRNLAGILALFFATTSFYEFIKFYLIIRASQGGHTELTSHYLLRLYSFYAGVDPRIASSKSLAMAAVAIPIAIATALTAVIATLSGIDVCARFLANVSKRSTRRRVARSNVVAIGTMLMAILPLGGLIPYLKWTGFASLGDFPRSVFLAFIASLVALVVSILLGISGRLLLRRTMERFDSHSALVFAVLYFLQVVPAIGIALCGYYWLDVIASRGGVAEWVPVLWLACQVIIALPLTASFVQVSHFRVATTELDFQESSKVGLGDLIWHTFLRRFSLDYLLVAIFGFSIIWTESTVNSTLSNLSRSIPSLAVELTQRVDGRGASYSEAAGLILATLVPVLLGLTLWIFDTWRRKLLVSVSQLASTRGRSRTTT